jgi:5-dehydro-2-deoxygluconokinase
VVLDIDYRPNLWGLAGHGAGEARFIASAEVSAHLQGILPACHLIVGTEEELHIAGGVADTREALARVRGLSDAVIVCKRGPMGCVVFDGPIPSELEDGIVGAGFPVEVYNVLGAGDAFMAGFLRGWLTGEDHAISATWANACGAFAVSRLLCSPEIPTWPELEHFLKKGSAHRALRHDPDLNHIHHATTRRRTHPEVMAFAFDHRAQFEELADRHGAPSERIGAFKALALDAALEVQGGEEGFGILCDSRHGKEALFRAEGRGLWIGRPVEVPGSRPLRFEAGLDLGADLAQWPVTHVAKCLCLYHLDDAPDLRAAQEERLLQLHQACRGAGREYMVEIVAGGHGAPGGHTVAGVLDRLYGLGVKPDWWKLEPQADATAWRRIDEVIARHDPYCRGVLLLGMDQPVPVLERAFGVARESRWVRGFAVGRTVFTEAAEAWFGGQISDRAAVEIMARGFAALVGAWRDIAAPEHPVA